MSRAATKAQMTPSRNEGEPSGVTVRTLAHIHPLHDLLWSPEIPWPSETLVSTEIKKKNNSTAVRGHLLTMTDEGTMCPARALESMGAQVRIYDCPKISKMLRGQTDVGKRKSW